MTMLARAYLEVIPSLKGAANSIRKELEGIVGNPLQPKGGPPVPKSWAQSVQDFGGRWQSTGKEITEVGKQFTGLTAPITGAAVAAGGLVGALGFKRLVGIDTARGQFKGLGYDADQVMAQVDKGVTGTALSMADGASMAVGILATGAVPMEGLEAQIQRTANVAAAYGVEGSHAANLLNQVLTKNKVTYGDLSQMQANGIPIISQLADHYGAAGDEIEKMAREGSISIEDMNEVIDKNAGAAAEEYAKTWKGVAANIISNLGRVGAEALGPAFESMKVELAEFLDFLKTDEVKEFAVSVGQFLGSAMTSVIGIAKGVITWFTGLDSTWQKVILSAVAFVVAVGPILLIVGKIVTTIGGLITAFGTVIGWISKLSVVFTAIGKVLGIVTTAFRALGIAMMANPAGLIIAGIVALVAALIWFFTQTELGQQIVEQVVAGAVIAWEWLRDTSIAVFDAIVGAVVGAWEWIRDKTTAIWDAVVGWVTDNWSTIVDFLALLNPVTAVIRHWDKIKAASSAAWQWVRAKTSALWQGIVSTITGLAGKVVSAVTGAWGKARSLTSASWQAVLSLITGAAGRIRSAVVNMGSRVVSAVLNAWNRARSTTVSAWNGLRSTVSNGVSGVVNFVRQLPSRILSALGNLGSLLVGSGRALIDGFTRGIKNAFGNAVNAVKNGVQRVRNFFPFSPAKEGPLSGHGYTSYSGRALVSDFAEGMAAAEADVVRQAESITRAAAFDAPSMPAASMSAVPASAHEGAGRARGVTNEFHITNPVAEPTSETARKASAYIGVTV